MSGTAKLGANALVAPSSPRSRRNFTNRFGEPDLTLCPYKPGASRSPSRAVHARVAQGSPRSVSRPALATSLAASLALAVASAHPPVGSLIKGSRRLTASLGCGRPNCVLGPSSSGEVIEVKAIALDVLAPIEESSRKHRRQGMSGSDWKRPEWSKRWTESSTCCSSWNVEPQAGLPEEKEDEVVGGHQGQRGPGSPGAPVQACPLSVFAVLLFQAPLGRRTGLSLARASAKSRRSWSSRHPGTRRSGPRTAFSAVIVWSRSATRRR